MVKLSLETDGETDVIVRRRFAAPHEAVYRAHIEPKLIQKWVLGPPGWRMTKCINEAKPGGKIHYAWANEKGEDFELTGEFLELVPNRKIVHVERMHIPDPTPDNHVTTEFSAEGEGTLLVMRMRLPDAATRQAMLETGMEHGMEESYGRLDKHLID